MKQLFTFCHPVSYRLGILALITASCSYSADIEQRPNFVSIFTDDMGYGDIGSQGAIKYETPNIDLLAAKGMRFTNFYVPASTCTPSRAGLLTGCYPNRTGLTGLRPGSTNSEIGIHPSEETMAELLKKGGYVTGVFGKWHLGHEMPFLPLQQGFDEYLGLPYSNDMWHLNYDGTKARLEQGGRSARIAKFPPLVLIEGNYAVKEVKSIEDQDQLTTIYTDRAGPL